MADTAQLLSELAREFGRTDQLAKTQIEAWIGEIVVDLLSQDEGRFKALEKTETISINTTDTEYLLPADFNTARKTFAEVDSEGNWVGDCVVVAKKRLHRHLKQGKYTGHRLTYIKQKAAVGGTPGFYLVLAAASATVTIFDFDYYRIPTANDAGLIRNPRIIKMGVRGQAIEFNPKADYHEAIYINMKKGFRDAPERYLTRLEMLPTRRIGRHNRNMKIYGGGG